MCLVQRVLGLRSSAKRIKKATAQCLCFLNPLMSVVMCIRKFSLLWSPAHRAFPSRMLLRTERSIVLCVHLGKMIMTFEYKRQVSYKQTNKQWSKRLVFANQREHPQTHPIRWCPAPSVGGPRCAPSGTACSDPPATTRAARS